MPDKNLILMRHADTENQSASGKDFDRTLLPHGLENAKKSALYILKNKLLPDVLVTSAALRATQTSEQIADTLQLPPAKIITRKDLYLAEPEQLLAAAGEAFKDNDTVLIVAHNPGIEDLSRKMAREIALVGFYPACLVHGRWLADCQMLDDSHQYCPR